MKTNTMNHKRADRVADLIRAEIADILLKEVADPRVRLVSITGVKVSDDLRSARIFFVEMGQDELRPETESGMKRVAGFLKKELGKRLQLRYVPELVFAYDTSFAYGSRIDRLLTEIHTDHESNE
jgi:ribosome-binding factor A